jgi:RNA polymerase sigma-70 factor (sigma-E family)
VDTFDEAYPAMTTVAYRAAYRLLGNRAEADDVASEAVVRAYVHWRRARKAPEAWATLTASRLALDLLRRRRTANTKAQLLIDRDPRPDPDLSTRIAVRDAIGRLPRRQREVVVLRFLADLSEQDVAAALGISVGTVKSHTSRAMDHLRSHLLEDVEQC